jgi:hypothetical protein
MAPRKIWQQALVVILLLLFSTLDTGHATARASESAAPKSESALAVSPAIIEEVLSPGEPVPFTLLVNNVTNFPLPIKSFVRNLTVQSAELEKTEQSRLDASRWFTIDEPDFILQPNQVRTVKGVLHPPIDAIPGGHYATIFFQPLVPEQALSPSTTYISARVGVLAFLVVKGDIEQKAIFNSTLHTSRLIRHGPATFTFSIRNTGNVHIMPTGKLTIYDGRGKQAGVLDVPTSFVLPDSTKNYRLQWNPPRPIGKYKAELAVNYGIERVQLPKTNAVFWIVPWAEIGLGILAFSVGAIFIIKTRRRWRKAWRALRGQ